MTFVSGLVVGILGASFVGYILYLKFMYDLWKDT